MAHVCSETLQLPVDKTCNYPQFGKQSMQLAQYFSAATLAAGSLNPATGLAPSPYKAVLLNIATSLQDPEWFLG
jgi:hypothetical protein